MAILKRRNCELIWRKYLLAKESLLSGQLRVLALLQVDFRATDKVWKGWLSLRTSKEYFADS